MVLIATGAAQVTNNTVQLNLLGGIPNASAWVYELARTVPITPTPFGDGLLGPALPSDGTLLGQVTLDANGRAVFSPPAPPCPAQGILYRYYYVLYFEPAPLCNTRTFNLSNTLGVEWSGCP